MACLTSNRFHVSVIHKNSSYTSDVFLLQFLLNSPKFKKSVMAHRGSQGLNYLYYFQSFTNLFIIPQHSIEKNYFNKAVLFSE